MNTSKSLFKKVNSNKVAPINTIPISIPSQLSTQQKEAILPFIQEKSVEISTKSKSMNKLFKKITSTKDSIKTEYKLTFIPIINKKTNTIKETVWTNDASELAQRIWDEDSTVHENLDHVVEWIGNGKASSNAILKAYMSHFEFKGLTLEQSFRNLCTKLHLKGETQQIDRILSEFSARYFQCNPDCIFGTSDVVHAIVYSLLLLNTDLHVAQGDYKKMSRSEFVKNTMSAINAQLDTPAEISESRSFNWSPLQRTPSSQSVFSNRSSYASSVDSMSRDITACSFGSKQWQIEISQGLKQMYNQIRSTQIANPSSPAPSIASNKRMSTAIKSMGTIFKASRPSSVVSVPSSNSVMQYQEVATHLQTELPTKYTSHAPYYKEGMVVRKHLLEKADQKAKHRDWKECFMVIERNQLSMYKLDHKKNKNAVIGSGDWMSNASLMCTIDLKHTLANALPYGYSNQRKYAFTLEQANGGVYVFQVGSAEQVQEWVATCNYWAGRESKAPLAGGVGSMEYGWGPCLESNQEEIVYEWQSPSPPAMSSVLDEVSQLNALRQHVQALSAELDQHRDIKPKMESKFAASKYYTRAMTNWEKKSHNLLHEIIKYQNYCNSIEKSLEFQNTIMSA